MEPTFRKSMAWLHTWAGVVMGSVLFAMFWMGTLSVFDREIDRWMNPGTRLSATLAGQPVKLDGPITDTAMRLAESAKNKFKIVYLPPLEKKVSSALQLKSSNSLSELVAALAW